VASMVYRLEHDTLQLTRLPEVQELGDALTLAADQHAGAKEHLPKVRLHFGRAAPPYPRLITVERMFGSHSVLIHQAEAIGVIVACRAGALHSERFINSAALGIAPNRRSGAIAFLHNCRISLTRLGRRVGSCRGIR
jgi:hypothetical protein